MEDSPSPPLTPKTNRGVKTKQKLLDAAEVVFGEKGYHQAGITDITQRAGVALGTFYTYFQSKEDIFRELVMSMQGMLRKKIRIGTEGVTDRLELERRGIKIFLQFIQKHPYLYRIVRQSEFVDEQLHRQYVETFAYGYIKELDLSMKAGQIRNIDPEMLAYCFMGIYDYLGMKWVLWDQREITDDLIEELLTFIKYGISLKREKSGETD